MSDQQTQTTVDATGADSQNSGQGTETATPAITFATEADFQKRIDDVLKERLERERKKSETAAQKAREDAEAEAAAKNGEWQKLAEQHGAKVKELTTQAETLNGQVETLSAQNARLEAALRAQLDGLRKDVSKPVIALLDKLDVIEQLEWLAANKTEVHKATGVPGTPKPAAPLNAATDDEARRAMSAMYSNF